MARTLFHIFLLFLISGMMSPLRAQEDDYFIGDFLCQATQESLELGEEYTTVLESPLVLATALVHINRINAGANLDRGDGCVLAAIELEDGDQIVIYKYRDISGEFASRYHFILMSEMDQDRMIALNTFSDIDAIAHELAYIAEGVRLYHLEEIGPEEIASHYFFAGEPSVNQLIDYVFEILDGMNVPPVRLDLSGEEPTVVIREDLLEEE